MGAMDLQMVVRTFGAKGIAVLALLGLGMWFFGLGNPLALLSGQPTVQEVQYQASPEEESLDPNSISGRLAGMLHLARAVSVLYTQTLATQEHLASTASGAKRLGIDDDRLAAVFDATRDEWRSMGALFDVATREVPTLAVVRSQAN